MSQPDWRDLRKDDGYKRRPLSAVRYLVIHHSAVDVDSTAAQINAYHKSLGWPGTGYHFLVHWDGSIDYAGNIETVRYNVAGLNESVIGVCLPGNWSLREPPNATLAATRRLIAYLRTLLPDAKVVGHGDIALDGWGTECPGSTWPRWRARIL